MKRNQLQLNGVKSEYMIAGKPSLLSIKSRISVGFEMIANKTVSMVAET